MGDYSELLFKAEIREGPHVAFLQEVLEMGPRPSVSIIHQRHGIDDHPWFHDNRFGSVLRGGSASHVTATSRIWQDGWRKSAWNLIINSSIKNYDGAHEKFLDWVAPLEYDQLGFTPVGYTLAPYADTPKWIYVRDGKWTYDKHPEAES